MTSLMIGTIRCQACNAGVTEENIRLNRCGCSVCVDCSRKPPAGGASCPQCHEECAELVQVKPCGCFLCRSCLISWLTATRLEAEWVCWSCGSGAETHSASPPAAAMAAAAATAANEAAKKKGGAAKKKAASPVKKRKRIPTSQKEIVDSLLNPAGPKKGEVKVRKKRLTFDQRYQSLLRYREVHGNINVPWRYDEDGNLGEWVKNVRRGVKKLTLEERKMLSQLGTFQRIEMPN